jgi:tape measure domain-containing protein
MSNLPFRYSVEGQNKVLEANERLKKSGNDLFVSYERGGVKTKQSFSGIRSELSTTNQQLEVFARRSERAFQFIIAGIISRGVGELGQLSDAYRSLTGQIAVSVSAEQDLQRIRRDVIETAVETRTSLELTGTLYGRLTRASENLALSEDKRLRLTKIVNQSAKIGQTTLQEQASGIRQLAQALESDRFQGDELRSVAENTPVLARAIADGLQVSIGELRELGAAGELNAERVVNALLSVEDQINDRFSRTVVRLGEGWDVATAGAIEYFGELDESRGISESIGKQLISIGDNFDVIGDAASVAAVALGSIYSSRLINNIVSSTRATFDQVKAQREAARAALDRAAIERDVARRQVLFLRNNSLINVEAQKSAAKAALDRAKSEKKLSETRQALLKRNNSLVTENAKAVSAAALRSAQAQNQYTAALSNYNRVASVSRRIGSSLLSVFGGVPGLVLTGVSAFALFSDEIFGSADATDKATDSLSDYLDQLNETTEGLERLSVAQRKQALSNAGLDAENATSNVQGLRSSLADRFGIQANNLGFQRFTDSALSRRFGQGALLDSSVVNEFKELQNAINSGSISALDLNTRLISLGESSSDLSGINIILADDITKLAEAEERLTKSLESQQRVRESLNQGDLAISAIFSAGTGDEEIDKFIRNLPVNGFRSDFQRTLRNNRSSEFEGFETVRKRLIEENKLIETYRSQNAILKLRVDGNTRLAEQAEFIASAENKVGGELSANRQILLEHFNLQQKLNDQLTRNTAISRERVAADTYAQNIEEQNHLLELQLLGLEGIAREERIRLDIARRFPNLTDEEREAKERLAIKQADLTKQVEDQRKAEEDINRDLEQRSDLIFDALTDRGNDIEDVFKNSVLRGFADGLAPFLKGINIEASISGFVQSSITPFFQQTFQDLGLKGISNILGSKNGLAGIIDDIGASLGAGSIGPNNITPSQFVGNAAGAFALGSTVGGLFGAGQSVGTGASIGASIGSIIPGIGTGIGALIGGGIGGLVSAFSATEKAGSTLRIGGDGNSFIDRTRTRGGADGNVSDQLANSVGQGLDNIARQLGGTLSSNFLVGELGFRKDDFFFDPTADGTRSSFGRRKKDRDTLKFANADDAVAAAIASAISRGVIQGLPPEVTNRLKNVTAGTLESVLADVGAFNQLSDQLDNLFSDLEDPLARGLSQLRDQYEEAVRIYSDVGADIGDVNRQFLDQQTRLIEEYREQGSQLLNDFIADLQIGEFSGLTDNERFQLAQVDFFSLRDRVNAGEDVDDQRLIEVSNAFLDATRSVFGFTQEFFANRSLVEETARADLANFNTTVDNVLATEPLIEPLDTLNETAAESNEILDDIRNGIENLNNLLGENLRGGGNPGFGFSFNNRGAFV